MWLAYRGPPPGPSRPFWSHHSFSSAAGTAAADMVFKRLQQQIAEAPSEWSLDYVEHHQMMERVA